MRQAKQAIRWKTRENPGFRICVACEETDALSICRIFSPRDIPCPCALLFPGSGTQERRHPHAMYGDFPSFSRIRRKHCASVALFCGSPSLERLAARRGVPKKEDISPEILFLTMFAFPGKRSSGGPDFPRNRIARRRGLDRVSPTPCVFTHAGVMRTHGFFLARDSAPRDGLATSAHAALAPRSYSFNNRFVGATLAPGADPGNGSPMNTFA